MDYDIQTFRPRTLGDYRRLAQLHHGPNYRQSWQDQPDRHHFGSDYDNFQNQYRSAHPDDNYRQPHVPPHQELEPAVPAEFNNLILEQVKMNQMMLEQMQAMNEMLERLAEGNAGAKSTSAEETDPTAADSATTTTDTEPCGPQPTSCGPQGTQQVDPVEVMIQRTSVLAA